jgi:hypothetical protein
MRARGFSAYMNSLGVVQGTNEMVIGGISYPSPERALFARFRRPGATTICHGDLNGNNVVVAERGRYITFIDFQDTGRGHVFEDFVALESSARLYFKSDETNDFTLSDIIAAELVLNHALAKSGSAPSGSVLPYTELVHPIRLRAVFATLRQLDEMKVLGT